MTPSPLRVRRERSDLLPDGTSAPTTVAVAAAMAISPHTHACDITRIGYDHSGSAARGFITGTMWRCWVLAAVLGPIAAPASWLLELSTDLQEWAFTDHPNGLAPRMGVPIILGLASGAAASAGKIVPGCGVHRQRAGGLVAPEYHLLLPDPGRPRPGVGQLPASSKHHPG